MPSRNWSGRPKISDYLDSAGQIALPDHVNLISLLDRTVANLGDAVAYRYVDYTHEANGANTELTWSQVGTRVRAVAARLQQVTARGDRVAVMAPQGLDYVVGFFAAIAAGNVSVPLFSPDLIGHGERLDAVVGNAEPAAVLTTVAASEAVRTYVRTLPRADQPRIIAVDEVPDSVGAGFVPPPLNADDVAYLQYTSGSTRTPTGVEISHRAAGTNLIQMIASLSIADPSVHGVSWLPLYHDMGLLMIGFPVLYGGYATLMSPMAFIRRPKRWIQTLAAESRHGLVVTAAPNFAFDLAAQRGLPVAGEKLNLENVVLINGSEPVSIDTISRFSKAFAPYGLSDTAIRPSYGMAEATLFVSSIDPGAEPAVVYLDRTRLADGCAVRTASEAAEAVAYVSCGHAARSQWVAIVDPQTGTEQPDGEVGEIWLHGNNLGLGYWGRPQETARVFRNRLAERLATGSHAAGAPDDRLWLRTGDLGVYLGGELYVTGRIKDMIIVDGRNHYPQDIEATVAQASPTIRSGYVTAFSVPDDTDNGHRERLVVVAERASGSGRADLQRVAEEIRAAVARRHGLSLSDLRMVAAGSIPRTTSGKLARIACRDRYLSGGFD